MSFLNLCIELTKQSPNKVLNVVLLQPLVVFREKLGNTSRYYVFDFLVKISLFGLYLNSYYQLFESFVGAYYRIGRRGKHSIDRLESGDGYFIKGIITKGKKDLEDWLVGFD